MNREPLAITTAISFAIKSILACLMAFGLRVDAIQLVAIMVAVDAVLALGLVIFVRTRIAPLQDVQTALEMPAGSDINDLKRVVAAKNELNLN